MDNFLSTPQSAEEAREKARALDPRKKLSREIERLARLRLQALGADVKRMPHNQEFDFDAGSLGRIEVKGAKWSKRGRRYEFNLRSNQADWLILGCKDGRKVHWFVVPFELVAGLTVIKVTRRSVAEYTGKLARYLGAWDQIERILENE